MGSLNVPTIGAETLGDLLKDESHMTKFEQFRADEIVGATSMKTLSRIRADVDMIPFSGTIVNEAISALVATDAPTPKGDAELDQMNVKALEYRYAMPLSFAGKSMAEFWAEVVEWLRDGAGLRVKLAVEKQLMDILRGLGSAATRTGVTVVDIAAAGSKWNNYTGATHNPIQNIIDLQRRTGATRIFLGSDVAAALISSPILTGSAAGSGREYIYYPQLKEALGGIGFSDVMIGHLPTNPRPIELTPDLKYAHDGVVAMWSPGAIRKYTFEPFQYDSYVDEDRRKEYYRALETSVFKTPYAEAVGVFTNTLA